MSHDFFTLGLFGQAHRTGARSCYTFMRGST